jgi:hypothetical protein
MLPSCVAALDHESDDHDSSLMTVNHLLLRGTGPMALMLWLDGIMMMMSQSYD